MTDFDRRMVAAHNFEALASAAVILPLLFDRYPHNRILDVGCYCGGWCAAAVWLGAVTVRGVDGPWVPREMRIDADLWRFGECNLNKRTLDVGDVGSNPYDLALCLEVLPHVDRNMHAKQIAALCRSASVVVFSAATPIQGYASSRSESEWTAMFAACGRQPSLWLRTAIAADQRCRVWYRENIMVFA